MCIRDRRGGADGREIVRLMQRRQRHESRKLLQGLGRDQQRRGILRTTVHHAMADPHQLRADEAGTQERGDILQCLRVIADFRRAPSLIKNY